jgi:hypothetical protein
VTFAIIITAVVGLVALILLGLVAGLLFAPRPDGARDDDGTGDA